MCIVYIPFLSSTFRSKQFSISSLGRWGISSASLHTVRFGQFWPKSETKPNTSVLIGQKPVKIEAPWFRLKTELVNFGFGRLGSILTNFIFPVSPLTATHDEREKHFSKEKKKERDEEIMEIIGNKRNLRINVTISKRSCNFPSSE